MNISFVVAAAKNNGIGKDGKMPWHLPNDLKHFKNLTWGLPILMGRKTFDSIGKALPGRKNIVLTNKSDWEAKDVIAVRSIKDAMFIATQADALELMVIGGGEIFKTLMDKANRIYMTRVDGEPEADVFFPALNPNEWHLLSQKNHEADAKNAFNYSFEVWERIG